MAMARGGVGEHLAGKVVQGGKEGHRSMPVGVVGLGTNVSLAQRQSGLGAFESLTLALFIADIGAFLGLCPKQDQSGETDKELRISKYGDRYLRRLLVGAAQYILGTIWGR